MSKDQQEGLCFYHACWWHTASWEPLGDNRNY